MPELQYLQDLINEDRDTERKNKIDELTALAQIIISPRG